MSLSQRSVSGKGAGTVGSGAVKWPPEIYLGVKHGILTARFFWKKYFLLHTQTLLLKLRHNYIIQAATALRAVTAWPCRVTSQKTVIGTLIISKCKTVDREHASDMHASSSRLTDCGNSPDCSCSSTLTNDRTYDLFSCSIWRKSVITSVSMSPNRSLPTFACTATSMNNVCVLLRDERSPMKKLALQCWHSIRSVPQAWTWTIVSVDSETLTSVKTVSKSRSVVPFIGYVCA